MSEMVEGAVQGGHRSLDEGLLIIRCHILARSLPKKENLIDAVCGAASRARADENQAARSSDAVGISDPSPMPSSDQFQH